MICINSETTYQGTQRVVIQADEMPETLPVTGEGVVGLADDVVLAPGSILYVVPAAASYFLGEPDGETPGEWIRWGGASEGEDSEEEAEA